MNITRLAEPSTEPLTIAELKMLLHVDVTDDDAAFALWLPAARRECEHRLGRTLVETTLQMERDAFPGADGDILLPYGPVITVAEVGYLDADGAPQIMPSDQYALAPKFGTDYLRPAVGATWPGTLCAANAVRIIYVAGHGGTTEEEKRARVPEPVRQWIALRTNWLRRAAIALDGAMPGWPDHVDGLLDGARTLRI